MDPEDNPYEILGVSRDSSTSQIKAAYRKLALRHHPDKQTSPEERERCHALFAKISNAYEILGDEQKRHQFDISSQQQQQQQAQAQSFYKQDFGQRPSQGFYPDYHFHDPFSVFQQVFGEEFGTVPRGGRQGSIFHDPFFDDPFGDAMMQRPFGGGLFGGGSLFGGSMFGGGEDIFSQVDRQMDLMRQQHQQAVQQRGQGNFGSGGQSYYYSSSSSSTRGGNGESVTTTARMINGKRQTVTERVVRKPDGTLERQVETTGDDDFPQVESGWEETGGRKSLESGGRKNSKRRRNRNSQNE